MLERAVETYCKAAGLAQPLGAWSLACLAWLGAGCVYLTRGMDEPAATAYRVAAEAAKKGGIVLRHNQA
jgi:hypothetical protein